MKGAVTKKQLASPAAIWAFQVADYRLRHNARYHGWPEEKRLAYCLKKAFDAAADPNAMQPPRLTS